MPKSYKIAEHAGASARQSRHKPQTLLPYRLLTFSMTRSMHLRLMERHEHYAARGSSATTGVPIVHSRQANVQSVEK